MKIKFTKVFSDYRQALECKNAHLGASISHLSRSIMEVSWYEEAHDTPTLMLLYLNSIRYTCDISTEEIEALNYAKSAIKILVDMGVLK